MTAPLPAVIPAGERTWLVDENGVLAWGDTNLGVGVDDWFGVLDDDDETKRAHLALVALVRASAVPPPHTPTPSPAPYQAPEGAQMVIAGSITAAMLEAGWRWAYGWQTEADATSEWGDLHNLYETSGVLAWPPVPPKVERVPWWEAKGRIHADFGRLITSVHSSDDSTRVIVAGPDGNGWDRWESPDGMVPVLVKEGADRG